jgi:hypothetical protein
MFRTGASKYIATIKYLYNHTDVQNRGQYVKCTIKYLYNHPDVQNGGQKVQCNHQVSLQPPRCSEQGPVSTMQQSSISTTIQMFKTGANKYNATIKYLYNHPDVQNRCQSVECNHQVSLQPSRCSEQGLVSTVQLSSIYTTIQIFRTGTSKYSALSSISTTIQMFRT